MAALLNLNPMHEPVPLFMSHAQNVEKSATGRAQSLGHVAQPLLAYPKPQREIKDAPHLARSTLRWSRHLIRHVRDTENDRHEAHFVAYRSVHSCAACAQTARAGHPSRPTRVGPAGASIARARLGSFFKFHVEFHLPWARVAGNGLSIAVCKVDPSPAHPAARLHVR